MLKNVATFVTLTAFDYTTGQLKSGDAANITAYVSIDGGATTVLADTSAAEMSATNDKGGYQFAVAAAECNGDTLRFSGKSSTANIQIVPLTISTVHANPLMKRQFTAQTGTAGTITLDPSATAADCERGDLIYNLLGAGIGGSNIVLSFNATTKIATMVQNWAAATGNPNNTTIAQVWKVGGIVPVASTAAGNVPADLVALLGVAAVGDGSFGNNIRPTGIPVG